MLAGDRQQAGKTSESKREKKRESPSVEKGWMILVEKVRKTQRAKSNGEEKAEEEEEEKEKTGEKEMLLRPERIARRMS